MAKPIAMAQARVMRKAGHSIHQIAKELDQPKSTVSFWCRDIRLSKKQIALLQHKHREASVQRLLLAAEKKRVARLSAEHKAAKMGEIDVGRLSLRDLLMLGIGLYWGEGYKQGGRELGFTNSDPKMIRTFMKWMRDMYKTPSKDFICRISINKSHAHRDAEILRYWVEQTGIPESQFTKTSHINSVSKKIYADPERHFGTLRIKVRQGSRLRVRILSSIQYVSHMVDLGNK